MTPANERVGLLRRRPKPPEITTPPAGTVLPAHVRTGAPDIPVTSVTPALPPGWEPATAALPGVPQQTSPWTGATRPAGADDGGAAGAERTVRIGRRGGSPARVRPVAGAQPAVAGSPTAGPGAPGGSGPGEPGVRGASSAPEAPVPAAAAGPSSATAGAGTGSGAGSGPAGPVAAQTGPAGPPGPVRPGPAGPPAPAGPPPAAPPPHEGHPTAGAGAPRDTPAPTAPTAPEKTAIQINALQAMCRQVFGFRLAMIALAAPSALVNAAPGLATRLVGAAVVVTFMGSYVLFRDWERFGPLLLRHPSLLAVDTLFGSLLLVSAGPDTTLAYVSVCTPLLAGLVYGWRGAAAFASLQSLILLLVLTAGRHAHPDPAQVALLPGLCVISGAVGSTLRNLMLRFGEATEALTTVQARLAVTEAVAAERARLAREMHDSVAKTLHGVALAADGLAGSAGAERMDQALVRQQAELVARSARRAAAEARELLADLRRESDPGHGTDVLVELAARTRDFGKRTHLPAVYRPIGEHAVPPVPPAVARQLLTIASEAMENAHRHAEPTRVDVHAGVHGGLLRISVYDDGRGLPAGTSLEQLRRAGHFGLVGMVERAASVGARIRIGRGAHPRGTEVRLELPLAALTGPPA